jgi:hypothetical protein
LYCGLLKYSVSITASDGSVFYKAQLCEGNTFGRKNKIPIPYLQAQLLFLGIYTLVMAMGEALEAFGPITLSLAPNFGQNVPGPTLIWFVPLAVIV